MSPVQVSPVPVSPTQVAPAQVAQAQVSPTQVAQTQVSPVRVAPDQIPQIKVPPAPAVPLPGAVSEVAESFGYATMGERFAAFLCDGLIQTVLVQTFVALTPGLDGLEDIIAAFIPVTYMALTEFFFHGSPGKRLMGIQVRADSPQLDYPSLYELMVRESIGKFLAGIILGIGFLAGFRNSKTKTWADSIAGTVVVKTRAASRVRALVLPLILCAYLGRPIVSAVISHQFHRMLSSQMIATEDGIDRLHERIFQSFFNGRRWLAGAPEQQKAYRQQMSDLLPALDSYDRLLVRELEQVKRLRPFRKGYANELDAYESVVPLRQEIAGLVRRHVQKALDSTPQQPSWDALLDDRRKMMQAINARNDDLNRIGKSYIPHTVKFDGQFE